MAHGDVDQAPLGSPLVLVVHRRALAALAAICLTATACSAASGESDVALSDPAPLPLRTSTTSTTLPPTTTTTPPPPARNVIEQSWVPFAVVGNVVLHHPSRRIELIGFHQSNHEGAMQMTPLDTAARPTVLESRGRLTGSHTSADMVSDPAVEIRSPVTGTVLRAGTYTLYCKYSDDFAVIEPDGHPGWEVKLLHINGVAVQPGDRVIAGETVVAGGPTPLPFESQVDEHTEQPSWPHVHLEVVDTAIPNVPNGGSGGCS
jgi:biotin carboxyl carrier protein